MYTFAVSLQVVATLICLTSVLIMAFKKTSSYSNVIIITFLCGFVQNSGYVLELLSKNVDEGMMAVKAEYLGGAFEICLLTFFVFKYCGHEFNGILKGMLIFEGCIILFGVWTWQYTHLYYKEASFISDSVIPHLSLEHGWLYYLFAVTTIVELTGCIFILVVSILKTNQEHMKYNFILLLIIVFIPFFGFIVAILGVFEGYDSTPFSVAISIGFFAFAIARNHVFDVADAAGETILSNLENAIIIINSEDGFEYSNKRAIELFPVLKNYTRGNIIKDFEIKNLFDESRSNQIKIDNRIFDVSINKVKNNNQEIGTTVVLFDVTESIQQIEKMKELKEEAENANSVKTKFLASVSHEIRTPINVIMGMSEVMLRDYCTPTTEKYITNINNSSITLLNLINDILDFSKMEAGRMELVSEKFDLKKLLSETVSVYGFRCEQKGLEFIYDISGDIPRFVIGDLLRIRQIISNIITNAIKYTEAGYVKLMISYKYRSDFDIDLIMAVEDTGVGIKREDYDKIFEGEVRADLKQHNKIEGTGLGLNITKQLLELMGGVINFTSEVGKGSVFSMIIPLKVSSDSNEKVDESIGTISKEKYFRTSYTAPDATILVVDDSFVNLMVVKELLKSINSSVITIESGEKCLELVSKEHFDVILLDHRMPGMDGIETLSRMRQIHTMCDSTPVIMYTANASADARSFYLARGFSDFLGKPATEEQIVTTLYKHLPEDKIILGE